MPQTAPSPIILAGVEHSYGAVLVQDVARALASGAWILLRGRRRVLRIPIALVLERKEGLYVSFSIQITDFERLANVENGESRTVESRGLTVYHNLASAHHYCED